MVRLCQASAGQLVLFSRSSQMSESVRASEGQSISLVVLSRSGGFQLQYSCGLEGIELDGAKLKKGSSLVCVVSAGGSQYLYTCLPHPKY